ncbi:MAG TPA: glycosyltransferase [Acidimicrobiia bacterium]
MDPSVDPRRREPRLCTIVIPAHNAERYLGAALDSALAQTYAPREVVVVDDGSTDGTADVIARYAGDGRVLAIRTDNCGPAAARNRGAAASSGEFLAFLDADDMWKPTRVERCVARLDREPDLTWVTADWEATDEDGAETGRHAYHGDGALEFAYADQLQAIAVGNFCANGPVIRRGLFEDVGGFEESIRGAEDYDLWIRLLLAGGRAGLVDEPLGYYRLHSSSLTARGAPQWESHLDALEHNLDALAARGVAPRPVDLIAIVRRRAALGDRRGAALAALLATRAPGVPVSRRAVMLVTALRARCGAHI